MDRGEEIPFNQHNYIDWKQVLEKTVIVFLREYYMYCTSNTVIIEKFLIYLRKYLLLCYIVDVGWLFRNVTVK